MLTSIIQKRSANNCICEEGQRFIHYVMFSNFSKLGARASSHGDGRRGGWGEEWFPYPSRLRLETWLVDRTVTSFPLRPNCRIVYKVIKHVATCWPGAENDLPHWVAWLRDDADADALYVYDTPPLGVYLSFIEDTTLRRSLPHRVD
jgi:hypothetical protein